MTTIETVWLLNSFNTLLNDDSTFGRFESRLTNFWSWVLFSDMITKPEFNISWTSWTATITSWEAIITTTRATSSPITWKKTPVRYQLSDTKTLTSLVSWSKVYIEIDQTLIDNPTLIQDTYPSTDYANWLNIWTLTSWLTRPTTNPYIPLWELSWITRLRTDYRTMPKILANRIDFVDVDWNLSTEWNITAQDITALWDMSATSSYADEFYTPTGWLQKQVDDINTALWNLSLTDNTFEAWEAINAWEAVYINPVDSKLYLTDADDMAKCWFRGISTNNVLAWWFPTITIFWINWNQSWLVSWATYYLSWTAWAITSSVWTFNMQVWNSISATQVDIVGWWVTKSILDVATYTPWTHDIYIPLWKWKQRQFGMRLMTGISGSWNPNYYEWFGKLQVTWTLKAQGKTPYIFWYWAYTQPTYWNSGDAAAAFIAEDLDLYNALASTPIAIPTTTIVSTYNAWLTITINTMEIIYWYLHINITVLWATAWLYVTPIVAY